MLPNADIRRGGPSQRSGVILFQDQRPGAMLHGRTEGVTAPRESIRHEIPGGCLGLGLKELVEECPRRRLHCRVQAAPRAGFLHPLAPGVDFQTVAGNRDTTPVRD